MRLRADNQWVRVVELSNHPGDMLGDAARRRRAGYALGLIEDSAGRLDRVQRAAIGDLIRRDHAFHGRRRRAGTRLPR